MICKACNSENESGSKFCGICGSPLLVEEVVEPAANPENNIDKEISQVEKVKEATPEANPNSKDNAELSTTVLTADMNPTSAPLTNMANQDNLSFTQNDSVQQEAPFTNGQPMQQEAPFTNGQPMQQEAPFINGQPMQQGEPFTNGQPMQQGAPFTNGQPMQQGTPFTNGQPMQQGAPFMNGKFNQEFTFSKQGLTGTSNDSETLYETDSLNQTEVLEKNKVTPYQVETKSKKGSKIYLAVSIVIMVLMAGGLGYGYYHFSNKVKDLEKEKEAVTKQMATVESTLNGEKTSLQNEIDLLKSAATNSEAKIADYETRIADYEQQLQDAQSKSEQYAAYDKIIEYAKSAKGNDYTDFFCSSNIVHIKAGEKANVSVFFNYDAGNVIYTNPDTNIASCEAEKEWTGNVIKLNIEGKNVGFTKITISNDVNDENVDLFVIVD
ncbi:MAG: hypothetical protein PUG10_05035 [Lachnospiraceae bacterium]|nr:hypothetical protein [Lachnospiraceae bacterium]